MQHIPLFFPRKNHATGKRGRALTLLLSIPLLFPHNTSNGLSTRQSFGLVDRVSGQAALRWRFVKLLTTCYYPPSPICATLL